MNSALKPLTWCVLATALMFSMVCTTAQPDPAAVAIPPTPPRLEFTYEARVKLGEFTMMGTYADKHERGALQLLGGVFEGPNLKGKILPSTKDWPIYLGNGVRTTNVDYVFVTDDGAHLFVTVDGYRYDRKKMSGVLLESETAEKGQPDPNMLRVIIRIQAPENTRYAWLNYNLFVGVAGQSAPGADRTAVLRVYRLL